MITKSSLDGEIIDSDASIHKAIHQLIVGQKQSLLVSSEGKAVGLLRLAEVCVEVGDRITAIQS